VRLVVRRGDERLERTLTLAGELTAFRHAFLGILPMRASTAEAAPEVADDANDEKKSDSAQDNPQEAPADAGVTVRMIYAGSPADKAGVRPGDRIVRIDKNDVKSIDDAIAALNNAAPGVEVKLGLMRDGASVDVALKADRMPNNVPGELPPAYTTDKAADAEKPADATEAEKEGETRELKLAEFPHKCKVYVPPSHDAGRPQAALIWLHAPGASKPDDVIAEWKAVCDRDGILLVVPTSADASRWERTEVEYLRRLSERVIADFKVDSRRVVVYGQGGGGAMAWLLGLSSRDLFRGIGTSSAALPRRIDVPANEPSQRVAIFSAVPTAKETAAQIGQSLKKLSEAGYPVTAITTAEAAGKLIDADREELARWIDTLDRL
jgi:hypothetical protein